MVKQGNNLNLTTKKKAIFASSNMVEQGNNRNLRTKKKSIFFFPAIWSGGVGRGWAWRGKGVSDHNEKRQMWEVDYVMGI